MKFHTRERRRAVAGVWVAMFGMLMTLFVGLAIDTSFYVYTSNQLQNIADASSLAGAIVVRDGIAGDPADPITVANDWAMATAAANKVAHQSPDDPETAFALEPNYGNNLPNPDIEVGNWDRDTGVFTPYDPLNPPPSPGPFDAPLSNLPNAVRVIARKPTSLNPPLALMFGPIVGVDTAGVERSAVAMIGGGFGAGLIVLNPDKRCSLRMGGNVDLIIGSSVNGEAGIQVNSDHKCAACAGGNVTVVAGEMNVVGNTCFNGDPDLDVDINEEQPYVPDPLADLPAPAWDPSQDRGCVGCTDLYACRGGDNESLMCSTGADCPGGACVLSNTVTLDPGYYSGGIRITSSSTTVTANPGVYVVDNVDGGPASGLYVNGGNLTANEVMFYVAGEGVVYLGGNGTITITPSSDLNDPYWGISIFQARNNDNEATIIGTGGMNLQGTYYFPDALLKIAGTPLALGNQIIAWEVWMQGDSQFVINYDGRFQLPGFHVFLVH